MTAAILAPSQADFAALCASRARMMADGDLLICDAVDELQTVAERSGLIAAIGQDAVQNLMGEAIAAASLVPDLAEPDELAEGCEAEIMLRAAELVQQWELADPRDRWRHTGERRPAVRPEPSARREPYAPAQSTVEAFWHVVRTDDPDYLSRWLADHPADAPELFKLWKARRC
ncbi:hypothetical protein V1279_007136 [Bradyrhizobium sp. AZCC 1610]|uniref:hypothetical protein n=1 Tax=Bradyrhizobium sp. AZCC 1610 TaxID=3117020 RepID=UPI002FF24296